MVVSVLPERSGLQPRRNGGWVLCSSHVPRLRRIAEFWHRRRAGGILGQGYVKVVSIWSAGACSRFLGGQLAARPWSFYIFVRLAEKLLRSLTAWVAHTLKLMYASLPACGRLHRYQSGGLVRFGDESPALNSRDSGSPGDDPGRIHKRRCMRHPRYRVSPKARGFSSAETAVATSVRPPRCDSAE
jgi:hypothetical protein